MKLTTVKPCTIPMMFHDMELIHDIRVVVATKDGLKNPVRCAVRMGRSSSASIVHAVVDIYGPKFEAHGYAYAGSWGYCKTSSAIGYAIESAGVILDESIRVKGLQGVRDALIAITRKLGYKGSIIVTGV